MELLQTYDTLQEYMSEFIKKHVNHDNDINETLLKESLELGIFRMENKTKVCILCRMRFHDDHFIITYICLDHSQRGKHIAHMNHVIHLDDNELTKQMLDVHMDNTLTDTLKRLHAFGKCFHCGKLFESNSYKNLCLNCGLQSIYDGLFSEDRCCIC